MAFAPEFCAFKPILLTKPMQGHTHGFRFHPDLRGQPIECSGTDIAAILARQIAKNRHNKRPDAGAFLPKDMVDGRRHRPFGTPLWVSV